MREPTKEAEDNFAEAERQRKEAERQTGIARTRLASIYWNNGVKAREQGQRFRSAPGYYLNPLRGFLKHALNLRLEAMTGTRLNSFDELELLSREEWEKARAATRPSGGKRARDPCRAAQTQVIRFAPDSHM